MTRQVYGAKDLQELLGVSESKAYQYIRIMNAELQEKGFLTVRGKIPAAYVKERFFFGECQNRGSVEHDYCYHDQTI
ncbi:MAG TPA: hypothetical protein H9909_13870 [Candidatus Mediterraneibacter norfolkensis]|nr:hypothetical protein [Candidatus Mediterraneibacter norfolkensis]